MTLAPGVAMVAVAMVAVASGSSSLTLSARALGTATITVTANDANADALPAEGPRIPLPGWPDGNTDGTAHELATSAVRGRELAGPPRS